MPNFVVSGLSNYVEQNRDLILKNFALAGPGTRSRIGIQTGVKGKEHLHYLALAPVFADGSECGFSAAGTATLTERTIETAIVKVNMTICPETLVGKYAEYLVRINATENDLPYEQYVIDGILAEINKGIEKLIWKGDKTQTSDATRKWINGFLKQFDTESSSLAADLTGTSALTAGTTAWNAVYAVYKAMPAETLRRDNPVIFVGDELFREFTLGLLNGNLFHFAPDADQDEVLIPATKVRLVNTPGLDGTKYIVGTFADNLVYGCDMENDEEKFFLRYSDDDEIWKLTVKFNLGVAYHFPDQIVFAEIASA